MKTLTTGEKISRSLKLYFKDNPPKGHKLTDEAKQRRRQALLAFYAKGGKSGATGKKWKWSEEKKAEHAARANANPNYGMKGKKHSIAARVKQSENTLGEKHHRFLGDNIVLYNYNRTVDETGKRIKTARLVAQQSLGRKLKHSEVIHHIGVKYAMDDARNKLDDSPDNLYHFKNAAEHMRYHGLHIKPVLTSNLRQTTLYRVLMSPYVTSETLCRGYSIFIPLRSKKVLEVTSDNN